MTKASFAMATGLAAVLWLLSFPGVLLATTLPPGFQESTALSGLDEPTAVEFASDSRVFVAEKGGRIKVFDDLSDSSPTVFADLRANVHNDWDRGMLGLALHPSFPANPHVYVSYTHDAPIGGMAPTWGTLDSTWDGCPSPPGATDDGCVVSGRLSRLVAGGNVMTGSEEVLIEDWCQQYPSHTTGDLAFDAAGNLYVSGGEGASFNYADYGQDGDPLNPCGDPPAGPGGVQTPPTAEGGALRSQDLRTGGDPVGLGGAILRVDPNSGAGVAGNPLFASADQNARRIIAHGVRNPFRMTVRPGTNEVWVGDVGWSDWEEIQRVADASGPVENFGWPCYEGTWDSQSEAPASVRHPSYDALGLDICENLYAEEPNAVSAPYFAYHHSERVVPGETCTTGSSSVTGLSFAPPTGGSYPAAYAGALFFADYSRQCIWAMRADADGLPDPATRETFAAGAANPVELEIGPGGDLFYVDLSGGTIRRIEHFGTNQPPTAVADATARSGPVPLTVAFDGTGSSDPDPGDVLTYAWDLDGDGQYDDSSDPQPSHTYHQPGFYTVRLRVTDGPGASANDSLTIAAGESPPTATIATPPAGTTWRVGDVISFSGSATDEQDGPLPTSALSWSMRLHHCPSGCHVHPIQTFEGVSSGSFVAPDHEYPSHLELRLTATDSSRQQDTKTVILDPETVPLTFESSPVGLQLVVGSGGAAAPFSRDVIVGSSNSVSAPDQSLNGTPYVFSSWSDGQARSHQIVAPGTPVTYRATFAPATSANFYPRPKGASPMRLSLVPAYKACTASNRMHGPPLEHPSCNPPALASAQLTVGSPDANGAPPKATGFALYQVAVGVPGGADDSDVTFRFEFTDVRRQGTLTDYTGELLASTVARITDRLSGPGSDESGTVTDIEFPVTVPCAATGGAASVGATCTVTTSLDAVTPGAIPEGKRSIWELDGTRVEDGGPDEDADTQADNSLFAVEGIFVP